MVLRSSGSSLTEGSIWKSMLLFALPVFLGNVFQQLYNTFDSWVVGNYLGDNALAAVSSSGSLIFMMIGFFNGVAMGAGVIIARCYGAKDYASMRRAIHTDVAFGLTAGILLTVLGVAFTPTILRWMNTPEDVLPQSISYFRYYFCGAIFTVMYNPLYYLIFSSFVNVVLDLLFVAVFRWGVGSAAIATTISQGVSALLCFRLLLTTKESYRVELKKIRYHWDSFKDIVRYGLPSGVQNSVIAMANLVVQTNINSFGKAAMAGCGSYSKIEGFAFLPITCFAQALSTFVGQNLGAQQYGRVKNGVRFAVICSVSMAELIGVASYLLAPQLISIFNDSPEVVAYGAAHMRTICLFYCLLALSHCIAGILRGAGKATVPMFIMLGCWCLLRVTYISIAMQHVNELHTVSMAYPITWFASSVLFIIYFYAADWMHAFDRQAAREKQFQNEA